MVKKNLGAPRSLTLRPNTAAPSHAHAPLQSPTLYLYLLYVIVTYHNMLLSNKDNCQTRTEFLVGYFLF